MSHRKWAAVPAPVLSIGLMIACLVVVQSPAHGQTGLITSPEPAPNPQGIQARAGMLMDVHTGQVLYAFNEREKIQPASLAKIMTLDLALEAQEKGVIKPDTQVLISENAWRLALNNTLSNMFIEVGDRVAVKDLLLGLMVSSGNDAAVALAEHLAGSETVFTQAMNDQARKLGLTETRYQNSHGLAAEDQFTTAADVAELSRHVITSHPEALKITSVKEFTFNNIKQPNWNRLVIEDARVNGLKTGHLPESGYHLAATATDRGMTLIAVVMGVRGAARRGGEEARAVEARALLNYGFNNFTTVEADWRDQVKPLPVYKGQARQVALTVGEPPLVTVPRGEEGQVVVKVVSESRVVAPVQKGQKLGRLEVTLQGKTLATYDLVATTEVPPGGFFRRLWDTLRLFFTGLVGR